jgi:hypothetical protein
MIALIWENNNGNMQIDQFSQIFLPPYAFLHLLLHNMTLITIPIFLWRGGGINKLMTVQKVRMEQGMEENTNNKLKFWRELKPSAIFFRITSGLQNIIQHNGANTK